ncbi:hypothetical protein AAZV13_17G177550 [Glycine max]
METLYYSPTTLPSSLSYATSSTHSPSPPQELCRHQKKHNPDSLTQEKVVDQISVVLDVLCLHHRNVWFKWQRRLPCVLFRRVGRSWKRSTNAPKSSLGSCRRRLR